MESGEFLLLSESTLGDWYNFKGVAGELSKVTFETKAGISRPALALVTTRGYAWILHGEVYLEPITPPDEWPEPGA